MIKTAEEIARVHHAGQFRRDGTTPYIKHPEAVADKLATMPPEYIAAAWLHDVLEDTSASIEILMTAGVPQCVIDAVALLTRTETKSYMDYLADIRGNEIACAVKIADMLHNLSDSPTRSQVRRYAKGLLFLTDERREHQAT